jgi:hypothetical protein
MKTGAERAQLDETIRPVLRAALLDGFTKEEIVFLLVRMLPELATFDFSMGQMSAAYDLSAGRRAGRRRERSVVGGS